MTKTRIPNEYLLSDVGRANQLVNPGLENWQRGAGPFTVSNSWTADRWNLTLFGTDTLSVAKTNAIVDTGSVAAASCTFVLGTGAGVTNLLCRAGDATDGLQIANRQCSFSIRVKTATPNAVRAALYNGTAWTYSSFHSGSNNWETLTVSATMGALASSVGDCGVFFAASCGAYIDNAMLVVGSIAADYVPLTPVDDMARCFRYYQRFDSTANANMVYGTGVANAGNNAIIMIPLLAKLGGSPSITTSAVSTFQVFTGGGYVLTGMAAYTVGPDHVTLNVQATGPTSGQGAMIQSLSASAWMGFEYNP